MTCKKCAAPLQEGQAYCPVCNTPVETTRTNTPNYGATQPTSPYSSASLNQQTPTPSPYSQPTPASVQNTAPQQQTQYTQQGQPMHQQQAGYSQAPQYTAPAPTSYQQPMATGAPVWQQPYSQPMYGQPNMYPQQPYGRPLLQPWQMQQNLGYAQAAQQKKWDPKKREKVLQNDVSEKKDTEVGILTSVQCFITILLGMLPIVGIFFSLFWVNSPKSPKMKRNMAKGMLILQGIVLAILLVCLIIWVTGLGTALSSNFV